MTQESSRLYLLPLSIFIIFPVTFATTYTIAVSKDHINAFFSYISDTGTFPPEMNIFAQLLNIAGVIMGFVSYVRFMQIKAFFEASNEYNKSISKWNKIGIIFGFIAGLGSSVVGNFQESNVLSIHVVGAWMAFGGGSIFLIIQAYFTFQMVAFYGSKALGYFRMAIGITCFCLFVTSFSTGVISMTFFTGDKAVKWEPKDGGWALRVTSVVTEWVMAALFDLYFLTLVPEFKKISFTGPKFTLINFVDSRTQNGTTGASRQKVMMQRVGTQEA